MGFNLFDRVKDTTLTTGTSANILLSNSAPIGYRTFGTVLSNTDTTYYGIEHQTANEWEIGLGTYTTGSVVLTRGTVYSSSNNNSLVNFSSGKKNVYIPLPANKWQSTTNLFGTYANRPTTGIPGRTYHCTDSPYKLIDNGTSLDHFVYGFKVTEPILSQWTVVNESPMTTTTTRGGIAISCTTNGSVNALHYYYKNCPSTPWSCEFAWLWEPASDYYALPACGFRENSTGKLVSLLQYVSTGPGIPSITIYQYTNATTIGSAEYNSSPAVFMPSLFWVKLQDNGTNRIFSISNDGQLWYDVWSVSRTTFLTGGPTAVFFGMDPYNRTTAMHLVHYREY